MTGAERGFLLLTSCLGDPDRNPLTVAQLRTLNQRVLSADPSREDRPLEMQDLVALGYDRVFAKRVVSLLEAEEQLDWYLKRAGDCLPITRANGNYPAAVRKNLGKDSPGCLWARGDLSLLEQPAVALVGSRNLNAYNEAFAWEAGAQAALQGYVLVSGNAPGADQAAQRGALENGGKVISVVADCLMDHAPVDGVLYLSEEDYDMPFSSLRALRRNRVIHCLGIVTIVAQCTLGKGGTWDGTVKNLKNRWTPVFCPDDGSEGIYALERLGAQLISGAELCDYAALRSKILSLF